MHLKNFNRRVYCVKKKVSYWTNCQYRLIGQTPRSQINPILQQHRCKHKAWDLQQFSTCLWQEGRKKTDKHQITLEGKKNGRYLTNAKDYPEKEGVQVKTTRISSLNEKFFLVGETFERQIHHHVASPPSLIATERTVEDNTRKCKCAFLALGIYSAAEEQRENAEMKTNKIVS